MDRVRTQQEWKTILRKAAVYCLHGTAPAVCPAKSKPHRSHQPKTWPQAQDHDDPILQATGKGKSNQNKFIHYMMSSALRLLQVAPAIAKQFLFFSGAMPNTQQHGQRHFFSSTKIARTCAFSSRQSATCSRQPIANDQCSSVQRGIGC